MGLLRRGRGCHFGTRAISLAWCCHAVQSQDAECQSSGAPCCALKYSGARNFFNEQDLRCEEVADDCSSSQEYDPQVNKCIDVNSALSSVTEAPTTTARSSSSGGAASSGCENCCGHGTVDPSDSTLCVCEPGWTSSALLGKCSVQVEVTTTGAAESKSSSFDYSFDFTFSSLSSIFLGNGPVLLLLVLVLCCICCYLCRCYFRAYGCCWGCCCWCCCGSSQRKYQAPPPILWEWDEGAARSVMPPLPPPPWPPLPPPISSPLVAGTGRRSRTSRITVGKIQPPSDDLT